MYELNQKRATLLMLDRTFDTVTPFLHSFNYMSLAFDLMNIADDYPFNYKPVDNIGKVTYKPYKLNN